MKNGLSGESEKLKEENTKSFIEKYMQVIPGVFEQDTKELERKISVVAPYVEWVQIDIADNTMVSAQSLTDSAGFEAILRPYKHNGPKFEAHLMVSRPELYLEGLTKAGFSRFMAHVECWDFREFLAEARTYDIEAGIAIDTETDLDVIEPFLEEVDAVLVMTVDAGASGQSFQPEMADKIRDIHRNFPDLPIEVDGGMNPETAQTVTDAGATRIVSTSYIFKDKEGIEDAIRKLEHEEKYRNGNAL